VLDLLIENYSGSNGMMKITNGVQSYGVDPMAVKLHLMLLSDTRSDGRGSTLA